MFWAQVEWWIIKNLAFTLVTDFISREMDKNWTNGVVLTDGSIVRVLGHTSNSDRRPRSETSVDRSHSNPRMENLTYIKYAQYPAKVQVSLGRVRMGCKILNIIWIRFGLQAMIFRFALIYARHLSTSHLTCVSIRYVHIPLWCYHCIATIYGAF
jgi:hypothetical protein